MKLRELIFAENKINIFRIDENEDFDSEEFLDWILHPIEAKTLSADAIGNDNLDGYFIIKAIWVKVNGDLEDCYINVVMPERISEEVYIKQSDEIIRKWKHEVGEVVSAVAIEGFGVYELFYSRINPEIGLRVLRNGLKFANKKAAIAEDLAYILRDEGRNLESIEAFTTVIENEDSRYGMPSQFTFAERAELFKNTGNFERAAEDLKKSEELAKVFKKSINN